MNAELGIRFGLLAPELKRQIADQFPDIKIPAKELRRLQRLMDAVGLLSVEILPDGAKRSAQKKIMRKIADAVREHLPASTSISGESDADQ